MRVTHSPQSARDRATLVARDRRTEHPPFSGMLRSHVVSPGVTVPFTGRAAGCPGCFILPVEQPGHSQRQGAVIYDRECWASVADSLAVTLANDVALRARSVEGAVP